MNPEITKALRQDVAWSQRAWVQSQLSPGYGVYEQWARLGSVVRGEVKPKEDTDQGLWDFLRNHPQADRTFAGATHEIFLADPVLMFDDVSSQWRGSEACRSRTWRNISAPLRIRAAAAKSSTACATSW